MFSVLGPHAEELVLGWGVEELESLEEKSHKVVAYDRSPVIAFRESGLGPAVPGWTFIVDEPVAADFWRKAALKVCFQFLLQAQSAETSWNCTWQSNGA
jgi:hypothetical protein